MLAPHSVLPVRKSHPKAGWTCRVADLDLLLQVPPRRIKGPQEFKHRTQSSSSSSVGSTSSFECLNVPLSLSVGGSAPSSRAVSPTPADDILPDSDVEHESQTGDDTLTTDNASRWQLIRSRSASSPVRRARNAIRTIRHRSNASTSSDGNGNANSDSDSSLDLPMQRCCCIGDFGDDPERCALPPDSEEPCLCIRSPPPARGRSRSGSRSPRPPSSPATLDITLQNRQLSRPMTSPLFRSVTGVSPSSSLSPLATTARRHHQTISEGAAGSAREALLSGRQISSASQSGLSSSTSSVSSLTPEAATLKSGSPTKRRPELKRNATYADPHDSPSPRKDISWPTSNTAHHQRQGGLNPLPSAEPFQTSKSAPSSPNLRRMGVPMLDIKVNPDGTSTFVHSPALTDPSLGSDDDSEEQLQFTGPDDRATSSSSSACDTGSQRAAAGVPLPPSPTKSSSVRKPRSSSLRNDVVPPTVLVAPPSAKKKQPTGSKPKPDAYDDTIFDMY